VLNEGDKPGGERCVVRTAGSETGLQRCILSVDGDKIGAVAVVVYNVVFRQLMALLSSPYISAMFQLCRYIVLSC
jgi:hypothetical protein